MLTIVGGHFEVGRRGMGFLFLAFLALAPFAAVSLVPILTPQLVMRGEATRLVAVTYLGVVLIVWALSAMFSRRVKGNEVIGHQWEIILTSVVAWVLVLYGMLTMVIVPLGAVERETAARPVTGARVPQDQLDKKYKPMAASDGSVTIQGVIERSGKRAVNEELRLLFNDGRVSPPLLSNSQGEFTYRLPAGKWRFVGPLLTSNAAGAVRYELGAPFDQLTRTIDVDRGPPQQTSRLLVFVD